ncbi:hypothetical protein O181_078855 [Austropuccinia psidii MF-1]|uniref:glucan 1,4-alpha-glucosidase n=1 Tax=Austropuccinia psidii MF-1 TaxID=1389203 RepID=A0A9Q3IHC0_9BASI|nr:hypothetical protein [Austropuccinia psidii MF-1]
MIASPSRPQSYLDSNTENANYFFHWTRDASLCLRVILRQLDQIELGLNSWKFNSINQESQNFQSSISINQLQVIIHDFINFNKKIQNSINLSGGPLDGGLGEPKFLIDGSRFDEPWGRPQHDGPAIRASTLIRFAKHLIINRSKISSQLDYISSNLFDRNLPSSPIQLDIDHIGRTWSQPSFDLWEEVKATDGGHFYTLMVQRKAIQDFWDFTHLLPSHLQPSEAQYASYRSIISQIDDRLEMFWNPQGLPHYEAQHSDIPKNSSVPFSKKPHIVPTLDWESGQLKPSQVDTAVILAINHTAGLNQPEKWSPGSDRTLATLDRLVEVFELLYPINKSKSGQGIAIGRYPEDEYDGINGNSVGHPWFLCTHAVAEVTYLAINQFRKSPHIQVTTFNLSFFSRFLPELQSSSKQLPWIIERGTEKYKKLLEGMSHWADRFLLDVSFKYSDRINGNMSEQIDRITGQMRGARELTWSYASFLTAIDARAGKRPN